MQKEKMKTIMLGLKRCRKVNECFDNIEFDYLIKYPVFNFFCVLILKCDKYLMNADLVEQIKTSCAERQGWMIVTQTGEIRESGGELEGRGDVAKIILAMLRDAGDLLDGDKANFQRLCVSYEQFQYAVQLTPDGSNVVIVKDKR